MNIHDIADIKEVQFTAKETIKYYFLFIYNKDSDHNKYFLWHQNTDIAMIDTYMKGHTLNAGEDYRIFSINLPA